MRELDANERDCLEVIIGRAGLYAVVGGIGRICHENGTRKQDSTFAKEWEKAGKRITAASDWIGKHTHL